MPRAAAAALLEINLQALLLAAMSALDGGVGGAAVGEFDATVAELDGTVGEAAPVPPLEVPPHAATLSTAAVATSHKCQTIPL